MSQESSSGAYSRIEEDRPQAFKIRAVVGSVILIAWTAHLVILLITANSDASSSDWSSTGSRVSAGEKAVKLSTANSALPAASRQQQAPNALEIFLSAGRGATNSNATSNKRRKLRKEDRLGVVEAESAEVAGRPLGDGTGPASMWALSGDPALRGGGDSASMTSADFDPSLLKEANAVSAGTPIPFAVVSGALSTIENLKGSGQGSRKLMLMVLTNLFRTLLYFRPDDLIAAIYFLSNKVAPEYEQGNELGVGDGTIVSTMAETFGMSQQSIKSAMSRASSTAKDLGEVAEQSRAAQRPIVVPPRLTIAGVFASMKAIACAAGKDSLKVKKDLIRKLLIAAQKEEVKYIVRMLQAKLRIGISIPTLLDALASAFVLTSPVRGATEADGDLRRSEGAGTRSLLSELDGRLLLMQRAVRQAFSEVQNFELILNALLSGNSEGESLASCLSTCVLTLGIPVKPMLAKPTKGISEVIERLSGKRFTGEWKYDGERAQIHILNRSLVKIYSRNSEDMTTKYPDVVQVVKESLSDHVESAILDSEVVAYDERGKKILPFQVLTTRGRKNIKMADIKVQVCIMPFDCMFYNGESYLLKDFETRRARLRTVLTGMEGKVMFAVGRDFDELREEDIQTVLDESLAGSCEGLMLKTLNDNAAYMPAKRSMNWLKLKKDYMEGLGDSIDVVPIGAWYGKGKRHGTFGAFLLAVYDPESEEFQTVCKAGTGFSDEDLKRHFEFFNEENRSLERPSGSYNVDVLKMSPDVWLEACQVWEIKAADLSISPVHTAAMGAKADGRGISLRFPRFIRIRPDKQPEEATTVQQIIQMFNSQACSSSRMSDRADEDDF